MSRRPNLLFIFTDEQRYDSLACYGNTQIEMPNLNRLADQSVVFDQAYVTQPLCTPARASIMTGLWPHAIGCTELNVPIPNEARCLPELVSPGQYATGYHGKWHLGDEVFAQHGFEDWCSTEDGYARHFGAGRDPEARSSYHHWLLAKGIEPNNGEMFTRGEAARLPEEHGKPAFLAESASRFIREHADHPWMLYVNFLEPHMPFFGPRDDQYDPETIPLPPNFDHPPTQREPLKHRLLQRFYEEHGHSGLPLKTEADWRRMIAHYWGLCSLVDTHAGRILDAVRETGQWDDTIIVFTSDHGDMMGSHRMLAKTVMYEESTRVPLLIKMPGQARQGRVCGPVSHIDLVPTLLDLMEQRVPESLPGRSLGGLMGEGEAVSDREVFIEQEGPDSGAGMKALMEMGLASPEEVKSAVTAPVRTVVTPEGWKLCHSARGEHELYNLREDPYEMRNLADDPAEAERVRSLTGRIEAWQRRQGDPYRVGAVGE